MAEPVRVDSVLVAVRHRKLNDAKLKLLADSMAVFGLQNPITVYRDGDGQIQLVAGYHRLEAAKLLGWEQIPSVFVELSQIDRDLWEVDENLCRAELSTPEVREHLFRRRKLWERQNNGTSRPANQRGRRKGFAADTAERIGKSKRQINRILAEAKPPKPGGKRPRQNDAEKERDRLLGVAEAFSRMTFSDAALDLTKEEIAHVIEAVENAVRTLLDRLRLRIGQAA